MFWPPVFFGGLFSVLLHRFALLSMLNMLSTLVKKNIVHFLIKRDSDLSQSRGCGGLRSASFKAVYNAS